MTVLLIAVGAAVGGPARYLTDRFVDGLHRSRFPLGILVVNVFGSFVLGLVAASADSMGSALTAGVTTGFCGALTTYSTFGHQTLTLAQTGAVRLAVANVVVSVGTGLGAAALGWELGTVVT